MHPDWKTARQTLSAGQYTCVLCLDDTVRTSTRRGVAPLIDFLDSGTVRPGFCAADRVVGRATAFLYCLLGARAVYARVMSKSALAVLTDYGIEAAWDQLVDHIRNRQNTGMCPMEAATMTANAPAEALAAIRRTLAQLRS